MGQQFSADNLDQSDTPLEIVQVLRGIPTATDHMRQAVQQVLHVDTPTRLIYLVAECDQHVKCVLYLAT